MNEINAKIESALREIAAEATVDAIELGLITFGEVQSLYHLFVSAESRAAKKAIGLLFPTSGGANDERKIR